MWFNWILIFNTTASLVLAEPKPILFSSYAEQRQQFLQAVDNLQNDQVQKNQKTQVNIRLESISVGPDLWTDLVWLKPQTKPNSNSIASSKKLVVISSGLHGIEGYVGSALQSEILQRLQTDLVLSQHDILLVHAINPWGMQKKRRVNEQNVDLNRNFEDPQTTRQMDFTKYRSIDSFLNPQHPAREHFFQRMMFVMDSFYFILKFGMGTVRQAILQGQYQQPKGIYFGGQSLQPESEWIQTLARDITTSYQQVLWIDLHTGYGQRARLHLLVDPEAERNWQKLNEIFKKHAPESTHRGQFYRTTGDLVGYLVKTYPEKVTAVVFEYGTLDSQKTTGSIESLRRMVVENQNFFWGNGNQSLSAQKEFFEMFAPTDLIWWEQVIQQTQSALDEALEKF